MNVAQQGRRIIPDQFISALKEEGKERIENPLASSVLHNVIKTVAESDGISSCSGFDACESYNEPSLVALNPNTENWCLGSFVQQYNGNKQGVKNDLEDLKSLTSILKQLEQTSAKAGSVNIEILEHLIHDTKLNLNRFGR